MTRELLVTALIGYGYWGPNLLRNYLDLDTAFMKWVCDSRPERLDAALARCPSLLTSSDASAAFNDPEVDAVVIATPISTHYGLAKAALEAGKHVFVEKPMTSSVEDAVDLITVAKAAGKTLMVGHTFVYSPPVRKVKELIDAGELGDIYFLATQRVNLGLHQRDVSVVWDLVPHDLSILHYWLDEYAETVSVTGRACIRSDIPDVAFVNFRFPSGVVAEVQVSWLSPVKLRGTIVVGSRKMLVYDDTQNVEKVKLFDHGVDYQEPEDYGEFQLSYRTGDIVIPKISTTEPLFTEASHFVECVLEGKRPITDGYSGLGVVAGLDAAERSLHSGGVESIFSVDEAAGGPG